MADLESIVSAAERLADAAEDLLFADGDPAEFREQLRAAWQGYVEVVDKDPRPVEYLKEDRDG